MNTISNRIELREKDQEEWSEVNENNIFRELQHQSINFSLTKLLALLRSDFVTVFDPFWDYFQNLPKWEAGKDPDYIAQFSKYVVTKEPAWFEAMFKKWLIRAIRCALEPTAFNKHCLVLVGERQNSGKSTWCRYLCPPALSEYMTDNLGTDKDSLISLSQNFIINLDELSTLQKADLQGLKSLFSLEIIKARRPYERITSRVPRTASFIGSTDRPEFLTDEAGSVRWICIEIDTINWQYNTLAIDKVWAQAYACYRQGERGELTREDVEKNELINRKFQITSPEMELISKMFRTPGPGDDRESILTATDIHKVLEPNNIRISVNQIGKAMRMLGFPKETIRRNGGYPIKAYRVALADPLEDISNALPF